VTAMASRSSKKLVLVLGVVVLAAAGFAAWRALTPADAPAPETVALGGVSDTLGGEVAAAELAGGLPSTYLIGDAGDVDALLAARATAGDTVATIVDVSKLDSIAREALTSRLVEAALDDGGAIAVDITGVTVRALEGSFDGPVRVALAVGNVVTSRAPLEAAAPR